MDHALATWVPTEVLVGSLTLAVGLLYRLWAKSQKDENASREKMDERLKAIEKAIVDLDKRQSAVATVEQLGRMGDRFDGRVTSLAQDVAVMKAVQEATK